MREMSAGELAIRNDEARTWIGYLKEYAVLLGIDTTREGSEPGQVQILHAIQDRLARIARLEAALREIAGRGPKNDPCADEYGADGKRRDQFGGEASWCTFTSDESQEESAHASDVEAYAAAKIARATLDEGSKT